MASQSDGGTASTAPQQEEFADPNETYPHASLLQSPRGIVSGMKSPEYDIHDNDD